jgi:hypothetical protein
VGLSDFVIANASISNPASPTIANLNVGLIARYHNKYADRVRVYLTASVLTQLVTDGFAVTDPVYKAASAYASAPNAPANLCVGRRATAPFQSLTLTCVDGVVGDAYAFTLVGSDGVSHALSYANVANPGTAVTGTVLVTNGSTAVTFSLAQTMSAGDLVTFSSQPGVYYALSAAIVAATAGTLTAAYQGTTAAAATSTHLATLAGTFGVTNGSATVTTSSSQVSAVLVGDSIEFASQLGVPYVVAAVTVPNLTLTSPYSGTTAAATHASDVCTPATAAVALQTAIALLTNVGTASVATNVITLARTDGNLTDVQGWLSNGFGAIQLADNTADPGIAADIAAFIAANSGAWYALLLDSNSSAEIQAAMAALEATGTGGKVGFFNNSDYGNTVVATSTDVFSKTQLAAYQRSFLQQNNQALLCYAGAATCGQGLAMNPGSYTLGYKTLPGVPADSDTTLTEAQALALNTMTASVPGTGGKNGNYYKRQAGLNWLWPGVTPGGRFFDLTIGIDWLIVNMQADVATVLSGLPKDPFTDFGIGKLGDAVDKRLRIGSSASFGLILPDGQDPLRPIKVTVPTAASLSSTNRTNRSVPGIGYSAGLGGAIQTAVITGTLLP